MPKISKKTAGILLPAIALVFYLAVMHFSGIGCPIRFVTGIPCPGCGMTRAVGSLLHLHPGEAAHFHPLVFLLPVCGVAFLFKERIPARWYRAGMWAVAALFVAVYVKRLLDPADSMVAVSFRDGLLFRACSGMRQLF